MPTISEPAIRLFGGFTQDQLIDLLTSAAPSLWRGTDVVFQIGLGQGGIQSVANIQSLTLEVKDLTNKIGAPLVTKTVTSFDDTTTQETWDAGTAQHALIALTNEDTSIPAGTYWLVLSVVTTDNPAKIYTAGGTILAVTEDGAQGGGDAPYFTQSQSDARYALKGWLVKNAAYDLVEGDQILADTSGAAFALTLPAAPTVGDAIAIEDAKESFGANNLTVAYNGNPIESTSANAVYSTSGMRLYFVWIGGSIGWRLVAIGAENTPNIAYVSTNGNDSTGAVGNPAKPFLTPLAAYAASPDLIVFGVGSFSAVTTQGGDGSDGLPWTIPVMGQGSALTSLSITTDSTLGLEAFSGNAGNITVAAKSISLALSAQSGYSDELSGSGGTGNGGNITVYGGGDVVVSTALNGAGDPSGFTRGNDGNTSLVNCIIPSSSTIAGGWGNNGTITITCCRYGSSVTFDGNPLVDTPIGGGPSGTFAGGASISSNVFDPTI